MNNGDSSGYYFHVVSLLNKDVGDYSKTIDTYLEYNPAAKDPRKDKFGVRKTDCDRYYIKYTLGVGLAEIPFFIVAHSFAKLSDKYEANGWSLPYVLCIHFSKVIYILLGILLLIISLERHFSQRVITLTVFSIVIGTNLLYHGTFLTMAHPFLFFWFSLLIYLTILFYKNPDIKKAFVIGSVVGIITLTRVPEIVSVLIPLLWGLTSFASIKARVNFFGKNYKFLLVAATGLLLFFSPQIFYWWYTSGQLIFNPYEGETFDFLKPQIINGFFSFKNGWLIYSPIMIFSLVGIYFLMKKNIGLVAALCCFVLVNCWIHYSYYAWSYFPGFGSRVMIECYPILAFSMAAFYEKTTANKKLGWFTYLLVTLFILNNLFQTWQMRQGLIWSERGSSAFFKEMFSKTESTRESLIVYDSNQHQPKLDDLILVDTLYSEDYEKLNSPHISEGTSYSGHNSLFNTTDKVYNLQQFKTGDNKLLPKDWLYVELKGYRQKENMNWTRDMLEELVVQVFDENQKSRKRRAIKIACHIDNTNFSIWHIGTPDHWGTAGFYVRLPSKTTPSYTAKVFVDNKHLLKMHIDDLQLELETRASTKSPMERTTHRRTEGYSDRLCANH